MVQTAASRPTNAKKRGERKAEKSMHLINKQKRNKRKSKEKMHCKYKKVCRKKAGRADGQRPAAWPGGNNKKYVPKISKRNLLPDSFHYCRRVQTAAPRPTKPKRRGKKSKKRRAGGPKAPA